MGEGPACLTETQRGHRWVCLHDGPAEPGRRSGPEYMPTKGMIGGFGGTSGQEHNLASLKARMEAAELAAAKARKKWMDLRDEYTEKIDVPARRALIGTAWRTRNRYSTGKTWWLYRLVTGITPDGNLVCCEFQQDCHGKLIVEACALCYLPMGRDWEKISESDSSAAWDWAMKELRTQLEDGAHS